MFASVNILTHQVMSMDADLEEKLVAENTTKHVPIEVAKEVLRAVASIKYGSVEVVIHEGKVVQIECREKIRVNQNTSGRNTLKL